MKGKRVLAALCAVLLALTLGACGGGDDAGSGEKSQEEELRDTVWADVAVECKFSYADVKTSPPTSPILRTMATAPTPSRARPT